MTNIPNRLIRDGAYNLEVEGSNNDSKGVRGDSCNLELDDSSVVDRSDDCSCRSGHGCRWQGVTMEEKKAMEARAIELSSHLAQARLRAEEVEQHLVELRKEADSQVDKLNLELVLALCRVEESEAWAEEAHDEVAIVEDMAAENIMKE
ncbi:hypothetical protein BHM03_00062158 [Ensete ventricosum]|uniref:Uncharacterized protein n=1 Tax=Ensete ventricosum TaxID=4639 RepID=A0A445MMV1_ENSVE|nr:hypothetical protein BHM03_00062158 [Ensete ventricosum]